MKKIAAVHTAMPMVEPTKSLFAEILPEVKLFNIVDDSLIQDVIAESKVTEGVSSRLKDYYQAAVDAGADLIFNTCSSVGDVAIEARTFIPIPIIKIDDAMAEIAVKRFDRVGVMATLQSTLDPTIRLIEAVAQEKGKSVEIVDGLAKGAFEAMIGGDADRHDDLLRETARSIADSVDGIVLAQGSMARMQEELEALAGVPVLSSPRLGVESIRDYLKQN
ncbi:MAG: aspartate/glutamate racemase family protein [Opitutales bacterium]|nr:aspartate/glutamate racemase family protein [Opitutales bacterium]